MKKDLTKIKKQLRNWASKHLVELFVYNLILILLVLLHSAGYFNPYFPLTINFIFFMSLILSALLLAATSRSMFIIAIIFSIFALVLLLLRIEVWAERTMIYVFQAFLVGGILLLLEETGIIKK